MSATHAFLVSLAACVIVAGLEGLCAGNKVREYFATLRFPRYSAPLWLWYGIGGLYYAIFFFVSYRLLRLDESALKLATLALIALMMILNALSNYVIFRARNLFGSFIIGSLFPILDITLFICMVQLDKTAAWLLVPYLLYRLYAVWWGYGLWKLNGHVTR